MAAICRPKGSAFLHVASHGAPNEYNEYMQGQPIEAGRGTVAGRVLLDGNLFTLLTCRLIPNI